MADANGVRAGRAFVEVGTNLNPLRQGLERAHSVVQSRMAGMRRAIDASFEGVKSLQDKISGIGEAFIGAGKNVLALTTGISGALIAVGKTYASMEAPARRVQAVYRATNRELEDMMNLAGSLSMKGRFSTGDILKGMRALGAAGVPQGELSSYLSPVMDMTTISEMNLGDVADVLAKVQATYGLSGKQVRKTTDMLVQSADLAPHTIQAVSESLIALGGVAKTAGADLGDVLSAVVTLAKRGTSGSEAGTALKTVFSRLVDPNVRKEMRALGMDSADAKGRILPLVDTMERLRLAVRNLSNAEKMAKLGKMFGQEGISAATTLMGATGEMRASRETIGKSDGVSAQMAGIIDSSALSKFAQAWNVVLEILRPVGRVAVEAVMPLVDSFIKAGERIANWTRENAELVKSVMGIVVVGGTLGGVLLAIGGALKVASIALGGLLLPLKPVSLLLGGLMTVSKALVTPLLGLGGVFAGLGKGMAGMLAKGLGGVSKLPVAFKGLNGNLAKAIHGATHKALEGLSGTGNLAGMALFIQPFKSLGQTFLPLLAVASVLGGGKLASIFKGVASIAVQTGSAVASVIRSVWGFAGLLTAAFQSVGKGLAAIWTHREMLTSGISVAFKGIIKSAVAFGGILIKTIGGIFSASGLVVLAKVGIIVGAIAGIGYVVYKVFSSVKDAIGDIVDDIKMRWGEIADAAVSSWTDAKATFASLASSLKETFSTAFKGISDAMKAGDWALLGKIATNSIELAWTQMCASMIGLWDRTWDRIADTFTRWKRDFLIGVASVYGSLPFLGDWAEDVQRGLVIEANATMKGRRDKTRQNMEEWTSKIDTLKTLQSKLVEQASVQRAVKEAAKRQEEAAEAQKATAKEISKRTETKKQDNVVFNIDTGEEKKKKEIKSGSIDATGAIGWFYSAEGMIKAMPFMQQKKPKGKSALFGGEVAPNKKTGEGYGFYELQSRVGKLFERLNKAREGVRLAKTDEERDTAAKRYKDIYEKFRLNSETLEKMRNWKTMDGWPKQRMAEDMRLGVSSTVNEVSLVNAILSTKSQGQVTNNFDKSDNMLQRAQLEAINRIGMAVVNVDRHLQSVLTYS